MGVISSTTKDIDLETKTVKELVYAARQGQWTNVLPILRTFPHLLNAIPEDRRWGILHQVIYWNNEEILKNILKMPSCDSRILTKETMSEIGDTSACTPYDLAQKYGYTDLAKLLDEHSTKLISAEKIEDLPTFHYQNSDIQLKGLGLFRITLSSYRQTFIPFTISKDKQLSAILGDLFEYVNDKENWCVVREKVCESLYAVCKPAVGVLKDVKTKRHFYEKIVNVYTNEETQLYMYLNTALRRQEERSYRPTAKDLALGPYVLVFQLLLMYWTKLEPETGTTYRRMLLTETDGQRYQKGTQFVWLSFVSSSIELSKAEPFPTCAPTGNHNIKFIIDNTSPSRWQPRNIEKYAKYVEKERVYPAGAEFLVTERSELDDATEIHLKLLDRGLQSAQTIV